MYGRTSMNNFTGPMGKTGKHHEEFKPSEFFFVGGKHSVETTRICPKQEKWGKQDDLFNFNWIHPELI